MTVPTPAMVRYRHATKWVEKLTYTVKDDCTAWCTACADPVDRERTNPCLDKHPSRVVSVPSVFLTEEDAANVLSLIEQGKDVPWRLVVKIYEAAVVSTLGEEILRDERDGLEKQLRLWEEAFERHAHEDLDSFTPDEACAILANHAGRERVEIEDTFKPPFRSDEERRAFAECARLRSSLANCDNEAKRRVLEAIADAVREVAPMASDALQAGK